MPHIHLAMATKPPQLIKASFTLYKYYDIILKILFFLFGGFRRPLLLSVACISICLQIADRPGEYRTYDAHQYTMQYALYMSAIPCLDSNLGPNHESRTIWRFRPLGYGPTLKIPFLLQLSINLYFLSIT